MSAPLISVATRARQREIIGVMTLAFGADPVARWAWPDPAAYIAHMTPLTTSFGGAALDHGSAWYIDGFHGASLWLPPDVHPDGDALEALFDRTMPAYNARAFSQGFEQLGQYHPQEPHWYLPLIGVDPHHQGRGLGATLMKHAHCVFDQFNKSAYLESSNPRNIPFYQRHGYQLLGSVTLAGDVALYPMLRTPHARETA